MKRRSHHLAQIGLFLGMILWIPLTLAHSFLLEVGTLNEKKLSPLFGEESGTIQDYLLNEPHWDVFRGMFIMLAIARKPCMRSVAYSTLNFAYMHCALCGACQSVHLSSLELPT